MQEWTYKSFALYDLYAAHEQYNVTN